MAGKKKSTKKEVATTKYDTTVSYLTLKRDSARTKLEEFLEDVRRDLDDDGVKNVTHAFVWGSPTFAAAVEYDEMSYALTHLTDIDGNTTPMTEEALVAWFDNRAEYVVDEAARVESSSSVLSNYVERLRLATRAKIVKDLRRVIRREPNG